MIGVKESNTDQLSALLGEPVVYKPSSGWFDYATKMRSGQYDIVFDGPHFTAWRLKYLYHTPVQAFKRGDCDVAMVRDLLFNRLPAKARDQYRNKYAGIERLLEGQAIGW